MKVLIDNGHGENTPGKRSPDGRLREWAYSREIADMVVAGLRKRGLMQNESLKRTQMYHCPSDADGLMLSIKKLGRKLSLFQFIVMRSAPV